MDGVYSINTFFAANNKIMAIRFTFPTFVDTKIFFSYFYSQHTFFFSSVQISLLYASFKKKKTEGKSTKKKEFTLCHLSVLNSEGSKYKQITIFINWTSGLGAFSEYMNTISQICQTRKFYNSHNMKQLQDLSHADIT